MSLDSDMNIRKIKHIAYIYIHFSISRVVKLSWRSHLQANREFTHSVNGIDDVMTFTPPNHINFVRAMNFL